MFQTPLPGFSQSITGVSVDNIVYDDIRNQFKFYMSNGTINNVPFPEITIDTTDKINLYGPGDSEKLNVKNYTGVNVFNIDTNTNTIKIVNYNGDDIIIGGNSSFSTTTNELNFSVNNIEILFIDGNGISPTTHNKTCGTTLNPWFEVHSENIISSGIISNNSNDLNALAIRRLNGFSVFNVDTTDSNHEVRVRTTKTRLIGPEHANKLIVSNNLNVMAFRVDTKTNTVYTASGSVEASDANKKNNIVDSDLGLAFIKNLRPVSYKFNTGTSGRTHYGLISQEVESILSNFNKTSADFAGFIKDQKYNEIIDEEGLIQVLEPLEGEFNYALRYNEFISPLIKAVQELSAKNEALEFRISVLENS